MCTLNLNVIKVKMCTMSKYSKQVKKTYIIFEVYKTSLSQIQ